MTSQINVVLCLSGWLCVAIPVTSCSSSTNSAGVKCGPGTTLIDSSCVPSGADAATATDSAVPDDANGGPGPDGAADGAVADASSDSSGGSTMDRASDVGLDGPDGLSDPCPNPMNASFWFNCDTQCNPAAGDHAACQKATCSALGTLMSGSLGQTGFPEYIIRTPANPGTDPTCATDCPAHPWAYGISATLAADNGTPYKVTVSPPWYLVGTTTPFCTNAMFTSVTPCINFDGLVDEVVYIVTMDPNAPARDVVIQQASFCP